MQLWPMPTTGAGVAPAMLVQHLGEPGFARAALEAVHQAGVPAASWAVYQVQPQQPPVMHVSASLGVADTTGACFQAYRDGLYRADRSFDGVPRNGCGVLRMQADDVPNPAHRDAIYRRHGMRERLSVVQRQADGSLLAVNFYSHDHQGCFPAGATEGVAALAPVLLAAVQRHVQWRPAVATAAAAAGPTLRQRLQQQAPALTGRELDVCERLLQGLSYDGVAADLGLSLSTVKTYRARAFARLDIHFRNQLFARLAS